MEVSVIIPVYNEEENISRLVTELLEVLNSLNKKFEIIFIDDGSSDSSFSRLSVFAAQHPFIKLIRFTRNFGQTAALAAGISQAGGDILILSDADLQNNPQDIPNLLTKLAEGYDVVSGWRKNRQDPFFKRRLPSQIANKVISWITGVHLHDYGCTLKAYRSEFLKNIKLYGEMHRFLPAYLAWLGAKIAEIEVRHRPRQWGKSKYGLERTFKIILDLMTVKFFGSFLSKPIYPFGGLGVILMGGGIVCGVITLIEKYAFGIWAHRNPLLLLAIFLFIVGLQFIMLGLLAEILIRTYYEAKGQPPYQIKETVNIKNTDSNGL